MTTKVLNIKDSEIGQKLAKLSAMLRDTVIPELHARVQRELEVLDNLRKTVEAQQSQNKEPTDVKS